MNSMNCLKHLPDKHRKCWSFLESKYDTTSPFTHFYRTFYRRLLLQTTRFLSCGAQVLPAPPFSGWLSAQVGEPTFSSRCIRESTCFSNFEYFALSIYQNWVWIKIWLYIWRKFKLQINIIDSEVIIRNASTKVWNNRTDMGNWLCPLSTSR